MNADQKFFFDECLRHAEALPVLKRASFYRGLAACCSDENEAASYSRLAEHLVEVERRCQEFHFTFKTGGAQ